MEGLGEKFKKARAARNLTLDEAARMTKIRPNKLAEIEAEDFSNFPSLAYAKGFVLIYGKFLSVDVSPYLKAFETSEHVTVDGYSYLQDNPAPAPRRTEVVRREPGGGRKSSLMPLVIGVTVLIAGFWFLKLIMDIRRIKPAAAQRDAQALAQFSPSPPAAGFSTPAGVAAAPRALPVDEGAPPAAVTQASPAPAIEAAASPRPSVGAPSAIAVASAPPQPSPAAPVDAEPEPEIRRAEPVHPEDLRNAQAAMSGAAPATLPGVNQFEIRPLKKTFVKAMVDNQPGGGFERWLDVSTGAVQLSGQRITVKVMNPSEIEIRKNGKIVSGRDADVTLQ
ncbi:hypothetical protein BH18VER1_BH18VER1_19870 [soil metagenome]